MNLYNSYSYPVHRFHGHPLSYKSATNPMKNTSFCVVKSPFSMAQRSRVPALPRRLCFSSSAASSLGGSDSTTSEPWEVKGEHIYIYYIYIYIYKVGPPSDVRWFINPMNTIVIGTINQLSYRLGAPLCIYIYILYHLNPYFK